MKKIYTHSGIFHADDVFCVAATLILWPINEIYQANICPTWPGSEIFRVKELPENFDSETDIALDVGGKHDPSLMIFDHHQKGGNDDGKAAVGKFWEHFGKDIIAEEAAMNELSDINDDNMLTEVSEYVNHSIISPINRADIGLKDWELSKEAIDKEWSHLSASRLISSCNPPFGSSEETQMDQFKVAVDMARVALRGAISQGIEFCRMKNEVAKAASNRSLDSEKHHYLVLENPGPWQSHVLGREDLDDVLYVIFPSNRGGFMVQCVPDALDSFGKRKELPAEWAGLRGEEFAKKVNLNQHGSATFCHPGRFVAGAENLEEAKILAILATKH